MITFNANILNNEPYEGITYKREIEIIIFRCQEECSICEELDFKMRAGYCQECDSESGFEAKDGICQLCSNGRIDRAFGEKCDDGNLEEEDGCSRDCLIEPGYNCKTWDLFSTCDECGN